MNEHVCKHRPYLDIANKDMALLNATVAVMATIGVSAKVYGPYPYSRGVAHLRAKPLWTKTTEKTVGIVQPTMF